MAIVRLGAHADSVELDEDRAQLCEAGAGPSLDLRVDVFAELADGRRIVLDERGYSSVSRPSEDVGSTVRRLVAPDEDDDPEPLPWEHLVRRARELGVETSEAELRGLPFEVELSRRLAARLA